MLAVSEQVMAPEPVADEVPEVVTVVDALEVLGDAGLQTNERLDGIDRSIRELSLSVQGEASSGSIVQVDDSQWVEVTASLDEVRDISSISMFLTLLLVCVGAAILGTRLFTEFARGWRH